MTNLLSAELAQELSTMQRELSKAEEEKALELEKLWRFELSPVNKPAQWPERILSFTIAALYLFGVGCVVKMIWEML